VGLELRKTAKQAAGLLASFLCKLNTFRKRVKNVVTKTREFKWGWSVNK
jgi:hypothetical protein